MIKSIIEFLNQREVICTMMHSWIICAAIIAPFVLFIAAIVWKENRNAK